MTPCERFLAALHGKHVRPVPTAQVAAMTTVEIQRATGRSMPEAHLDADTMVSLCAANHEILHFDAVTFILNYFNEPAALGVEMDWGTPSQWPTYRSHPWRHVSDIKIPADFLDRAPVKTCLESVGIARHRYGDTIGVLGKIMGPLSFVQVMHGVEDTMTGLVTDPETVAAFLDASVEVLLAYGNAQFDRGVHALTIGEGGAGAAMLSPTMYGDMLLPAHRRLIRGLNGPTILHMCGDITPRLAMIEQTGLTCFNFDWAIKPEDMIRAAEGRFSVMGNISTADLLNGAPPEIQAQTAACIEAGVHIISPGCAISPNCPNANLRAMVATTQELS